MFSGRVLFHVCRRNLLLSAKRPPLTRYIASTTPRRAFEFPGLNAHATKAIHDSPLFKKLSEHAPALEAMQKFAEVSQKLGVTVEPGKQPSTLQMLKLATNSEFREASKKMVEEFKKAGVDLTSPDVAKEMQSIAQLFAAPKNS